jgi:hypothetical protein
MFIFPISDPLKALIYSSENRYHREPFCVRRETVLPMGYCVYLKIATDKWFTSRPFHQKYWNGLF